MDVNAYNVARTAVNANVSLSKKNGTTLDMNDFLKLLTAQLANQDVMNPQQDTEFIAQMAQFTSLQAMQTLTELTYAQYGASMIGKNVIVAEMDNKGALIEDQGIVTNVRFLNGEVSITVNGKEYNMSAIMEILTENNNNSNEQPEQPEVEKA